MELAGLKVVLDGDVTKLEAALARGTEYLKSYAKYAQDMFKGIKIDVGNIQGATQAQKDAADAAYKLAQAKLAEARADKIRFDMANKTEAQKKREKDLYDELVAQNNAIVREYYNASAAVAKYGDASGISAAKLEEMRVAAQKGQQQLQQIEQGAGRFQRSVGNYATGINPLMNSINQLTREMPAFANSVQTGFMAISNNIPAFSDAISQLVRQQKQAAEELKKVISVQLTKARAEASEHAAVATRAQAAADDKLTKAETLVAQSQLAASNAAKLNAEASILATGAAASQTSASAKLAQANALLAESQLAATSAAKLKAEAAALVTSANAAQAASEQKLAQAQQLSAAQQAKTPGVMKALLSAVFSWNTALSVGITLLTVYGKDIVNWIRGTKQAEEAQKRLNEEKKKSDDIDRQSNSRAGEQIATLRVLVGTLESTTTSYKAKQGAIKKLQETWPSYFSNLDMAAVKNGKLAEQVKQLTTDILASARAMAAMNKIVANEQDILNAQLDENEVRMKYSQAAVKLDKIKREINQRTTSPDPATTSGAYMSVGPGLFGKSISEQEGEIKDYKDRMNDLSSFQRRKAHENEDLVKRSASINTGRLSMDGTDAAKYNGKAKTSKSDETPLQKLSKDLQQINIEKSRNIITALDALNQQLAAYEEFLKNTAVGKNALPNDNAFVQSAMSNIDRLKTAIAQAELEVRPKIAPIEEKEVNKLDESIKASAKTVTITLKPVIDKVSVDQAKIDAEALGKEISNSLREQMVRLATEIGVTIGEGIGNAVSGEGSLGDVLKSIGNALSNFLAEVGKMLIESGVRALAAKTAALSVFAQPGIAIGVGVATVAASQILKNGVNKAQKGVKFADGGIVYGRTQALVGEYSNARSNPEVIAPLDKLTAKLREVGFNNRQNSMAVEVYGTISGEDIVLSSKRTQDKRYF